MLVNVFSDGAVGYGRFRAHAINDRQADFELILLPLIHAGESINRILGRITAIDPPFWLGSEPLARHEVVELNLHWPDGVPAFMTQRGAEVISLSRRRLRLLTGGLGGES